MIIEFALLTRFSLLIFLELKLYKINRENWNEKEKNIWNNIINWENVACNSNKANLAKYYR